MKTKGKELVAIVTAAVLFLVLTYGVAWLIMPTRVNSGATWEMYLQEERDSIDVMYFGSSIVYCDIIPSVIWEETGLTTYVMAGPAQAMPTTWYYLREACKTQSPQVVVVELNGLYFEEYPDSSKPNLTFMPWSLNRIQAILDCAAPEDQLGMLFPMYSYHDCVYNLDLAGVQQHLFPQADVLAGYTPVYQVSIPQPDSQRSYSYTNEFYETSIRYLRKISDYCAQQGIQLVFYLAPTYAQIPEDTLDVLQTTIDTMYCTKYINCNTEGWIELDPYSAWCDFLHLNIQGAIPFSRRFAQELDSLGLNVTHTDSPLWQERANALYTYLA